MDSMASHITWCKIHLDFGQSDSRPFTTCTVWLVIPGRGVTVTSGCSGVSVSYKPTCAISGDVAYSSKWNAAIIKVISYTKCLPRERSKQLVWHFTLADLWRIYPECDNVTDETTGGWQGPIIILKFDNICVFFLKFNFNFSNIPPKFILS